METLYGKRWHQRCGSDCGFRCTNKRIPIRTFRQVSRHPKQLQDFQWWGTKWALDFLRLSVWSTHNTVESRNEANTNQFFPRIHKEVALCTNGGEDAMQQMLIKAVVLIQNTFYTIFVWSHLHKMCNIMFVKKNCLMIGISHHGGRFHISFQVWYNSFLLCGWYFWTF